MESLAISLPREALESFCRKWKIRRLAIFGSALRSDFRADSDVDLLATFADDARWSLWDMHDAEAELANLFGRPVDLIDQRSVEESENWLRRNSILSTARTIYGG